jgi:hypothetical protein
MSKSRNPRRTVLQSVKAGRSILSEVFKTWNQPQTMLDTEYRGGVKRGLSDDERRENQPEAWKGLADHGLALIEIGEFYRDYADANQRKLAGEDVDMTDFEGAEPSEGPGTEDTEDVPLPGDTES